MPSSCIRISLPFKSTISWIYLIYLSQIADVHRLISPNRRPKHKYTCTYADVTDPFTPINSYCKITIHYVISRFILSPIGLGSNMRKSLFRRSSFIWECRHRPSFHIFCLVSALTSLLPPSQRSHLPLGTRKNTLVCLFLAKLGFFISTLALESETAHSKFSWLSGCVIILSCMRYLCNADFTLQTSGAMRTISMISESHTYWTRLKAAAKIVSWVWLRHSACCSDLVERYTPALCIYVVIPVNRPSSLIGTPTKLGVSIPW